MRAPRRFFTSACVVASLGLAACAPSPPAACPPAASAQPPAASGHHTPANGMGAHTKPQHHGQPHHGQPHHGEAHPGKHATHGEHDGPLVHRFVDAEAWAERFESPEREISQKPAALVAAMAIPNGATVADVGTGTGYFLPHLSRAVGPQGTVLAVDIEPAMIRWVKARAQREGLSNVEPRLALLDDPLLPAKQLDRVLIVNTWHHIADREAYARKIAQALSANGSLWVVDFKLDSPRGPHRKHRLAPEQIVAELTAAGFMAQQNDKLLPDQYIIHATLPQNAASGSPP